MSSWKQAHFTAPTVEGHLRVCFGAEPIERIEEAMDRLEKYFVKLDETV